MVLPFDGAVLTGGRSRRMGRDKALVVVDGRPLATVASDALRAAGAGDVIAVGGDGPALEAFGFRWVADGGGLGPLDGLACALAAARADVVVVLACDLPAIAAAAIEAVITELTAHAGADVAVPLADGHDQVLLAAWRRVPALAAARAALEAGRRSLHAALDALEVHRFALAEPAWARNANTPADLVDR